MTAAYAPCNNKSTPSKNNSTDMAGADRPPFVGPMLPGADSFPHAGVVEVNEQCLELLVHQARTAPIPPFQLVMDLRDSLRQMTPERRKRAAARPFLLLDLEFQNPEWWDAVRRYPDKKFRTSSWRGSLPRRSGLPLARATLLLAWQGCRAHLETACILFGMSRAAAEVIIELQLTEIDRIADRRFRHLHPRWQDRPDVWRLLLAAAESPSAASLRRTDIHALALVAAELMPLRTGPGGT